MNKIITISLIASLSLIANSDLEQRLNSLEAEIKQLKSQTNNISADIEEYLPIVEKSETKSILDKINFTPELELRMDKMDYKLGDIEGENTIIQSGDYAGQTRRTNYSKDFKPAVSVKFKLNMSAQIDENVKFNGRLIFANSTQSYERLCILSRDIKSASTSSAFDLDRAYIDYTPNIGSDYSFTFSFGVLPTTGGTPMQYAQGTQRASMFPALVFDMNTYGIIGTQKFNNDNFLRVIAAKAYTLRDSFYPYQCNRENIDNADILGAYFDTKLSFLGDSLLSFGVNYLDNFKAHPYLGPDVSAQNSNVLGELFTYGIGLDAENIKDTGLTVFAHAALSHMHPNGEEDSYQIVDANNDNIQDDPNDTGFSLADYSQGAMIEDNGYSIYIGANYNLSNNINVGAEYNQGSKYWFSATQGAEDVFNKLATRGDVTEVYSMWEFHKDMHIKIGHMCTNENYTGSGWHFGEPAKKDGEQHISYVSIKAKF